MISNTVSRVTCIVVLVIAQLGASFVPSVRADDDPVLTSASVSFHTNDDDKDHDTILRMSLEKGPEEFADPRWSLQNRSMRVTSKAANGDDVRDKVFYSFMGI